jgi:hypothetical protein
MKTMSDPRKKRPVFPAAGTGIKITKYRLNFKIFQNLRPVMSAARMRPGSRRALKRFHASCIMIWTGAASSRRRFHLAGIPAGYVLNAEDVLHESDHGASTTPLWPERSPHGLLLLLCSLTAARSSCVGLGCRAARRGAGRARRRVRRVGIFEHVLYENAI